MPESTMSYSRRKIPSTILSYFFPSWLNLVESDFAQPGKSLDWAEGEFELCHLLSLIQSGGGTKLTTNNSCWNFGPWIRPHESKVFEDHVALRCSHFFSSVLMQRSNKKFWEQKMPNCFAVYQKSTKLLE